MRIYPKPLSIDPEDIFKHDCFEREQFCIELNALIESINEPLVINLDAQWGDGKTTFIQLWREYLKARPDSVETIYIDAFEYDYISDPYIAITGSILKSLQTSLKQHISQEKSKEFKNAALNVGKVVLSKSIGLGLKAITLNTITSEDFKDIEKDIGDTLKNSTTSYLEQKLEKNEDEASLTHFREVLKKSAEEVRQSQGFPLVVIIDELDRCRPDYALEVLEKVKHLFCVDNVVFVLSMNNEQIEGSVKGIYGADIKAKDYLQKFYHLHTRLPKQYGSGKYNDRNFGNDFVKYCQSMSERFELLNTKREKEAADTLKLAISSFAEFYDLSYRKIEKVYTILMPCWPRMHTYAWDIISISALFAVWKLERPDLYEKAKSKFVLYESLYEAAGFEDFSSEYYSNFNFEAVESRLSIMYEGKSDEANRPSIVGGSLFSPDGLRSMIIKDLETFRFSKR
ncbi:KAP family P-loop NTPase fold protein [Endozoicomonas ascidiicola]|uniref:KAP family P-loop NTPase fold protein n=1 Tax=Endozoicomonas ascidiicola TaxID=1698521 RepID=UPI0008316466|nr:P-loop NTPase fold protein [Endozoicomonas ascidiicola]